MPESPDLNLVEHNPAADALAGSAQLTQKWIDELIGGWMGSTGPESSFSRMERSGALVHQALVDGLEDKYKDMPKTAAEMTAVWAESVTLGIPLGLAPLVGGLCFGHAGATVGCIAAVGLGLVLPAVPKLSAMKEAISDYWNHPERRETDKQILSDNSSVILDTAARYAGLNIGGRLGQAYLAAPTISAFSKLHHVAMNKHII